MEYDRESKIPQYLQELLTKLEQQLENPKNTWKRRQGNPMANQGRAETTRYLRSQQSTAKLSL